MKQKLKEEIDLDKEQLRMEEEARVAYNLSHRDWFLIKHAPFGQIFKDCDEWDFHEDREIYPLWIRNKTELYGVYVDWNKNPKV